ncbi:hypothetical protein Droror1_Dr00009418 [Drosera rotundifolia]
MLRHGWLCEDVEESGRVCRGLVQGRRRRIRTLVLRRATGLGGPACCCFLDFLFPLLGRGFRNMKMMLVIFSQQAATVSMTKVAVSFTHIIKSGFPPSIHRDKLSASEK